MQEILENKSIVEILNNKNQFNYKINKKKLSHEKTIKDSFAYDVLACLLDTYDFLKENINELAKRFFIVFFEKVKNKKDCSTIIKDKEVYYLRAITSASGTHVKEGLKKWEVCYDRNKKKTCVKKVKNEEERQNEIKNPNHFKKLPELNNIKQISTNKIPNINKDKSIKDKVKPIEKFIYGSNNGLFLNDLPTGSGKSYLTAWEMKQHLLKNEEKKIVFFTDKTENVLAPFKTLTSLIADDKKLTDEEKAYFLNQIGLIYSKEDTLNSLSIESFNYLFEEIKELCFQKKEEIAKLINTFEIMFNSFVLDKKNNINKKEEIKDKVSDVYWHINKIIRIAKQLKQSDNLSQESKFILSLLYPADLYAERKVLFLTTKKALYNISGFRYKSISLLSIEDNIIFIDEFDAQKKVMDDTFADVYPFLLNQHLVELNKTFSTMNIPSQQLCPNLNKYVKEFISFLKSQEVKDLSPANSIYYIDKEDERKPLSLLFDGASESILSTNDKLFRFKKDEIENKNYLIAEELSQSQIPLNEQFTQFLKNLELFESNFVKMIRKIIDEFLSQSPNCSHDEALARVLDWLSIETGINKKADETSIYNRMKKLLSSGRLTKMKSSKSVVQTYFEQLSIYNFPFRNYDDKIIDISHYKILYNSHVFLAQLCKKNKVVGLSATIKTESNIKNFDLEYLESVLGEGLKGFTKEEYKEIKKSLNKNQQNIKIHSVDSDIVTSERSSFINNDKLKGLFKFNEEFKEIDRKRLLMIEDSMIQFINSGSRYMVCFLSRSVSKECLEEMKKTISEKVGFDGLQISKMLAKDLKDIDKDDEKKIIKSVEEHLEKDKNNKSIIFTTYQTAGSGFNLQRRILKNEKEGEDYIKLTNNYNSNKIDIDAMFLDDPTGFLIDFITDNNEKSFVLVLLKTFRILKEMKKQGYLTYSEYASFLRKTSKSRSLNSFQSPKGPRNTLNSKYEKTFDFSESIMALVRQVLGRMVRTNNRSMDVNVFMSSTFIQKIRSNGLITPIEFETNEMLNLIKTINESTILIEPQSKESQEMSRKMNQNNSHIKQLNSIIHNPAHHLHEDAKLEWKTIRDFLLKNGVYFKAAELKEDLEFKGMNWNQKKPYSFNKNQSNYDNPENFKLVEKGISLDEKFLNLHLLKKNRFLTNHFKKRGYCLEFNIKGTDSAFDPVVVNNIYKGALGEEIVKAYFNRISPCLVEIEDERFEKMDYLIKDFERAGVDAKYWQHEKDDDKENFFNNIKNKMKLPYNGGDSFKRVAIVNVFDEKPVINYVNDEGISVDKEDAVIVLYSGILSKETGAELDDTSRKIEEVKEWLKAYK